MSSLTSGGNKAISYEQFAKAITYFNGLRETTPYSPSHRGAYQALQDLRRLTDKQFAPDSASVLVIDALCALIQQNAIQQNAFFSAEGIVQSMEVQPLKDFSRQLGIFIKGAETLKLIPDFDQETLANVQTNVEEVIEDVEVANRAQPLRPSEDKEAPTKWYHQLGSGIIDLLKKFKELITEETKTRITTVYGSNNNFNTSLDSVAKSNDMLVLGMSQVHTSQDWETNTGSRSTIDVSQLIEKVGNFILNQSKELLGDSVKGRSNAIDNGPRIRNGERAKGGIQHARELGCR